MVTIVSGITSEQFGPSGISWGWSIVLGKEGRRLVVAPRIAGQRGRGGRRSEVDGSGGQKQVHLMILIYSTAVVCPVF